MLVEFLYKKFGVINLSILFFSVIQVIGFFLAIHYNEKGRELIEIQDCENCDPYHGLGEIDEYYLQRTRWIANLNMIFAVV